MQQKLWECSEREKGLNVKWCILLVETALVEAAAVVAATEQTLSTGCVKGGDVPLAATVVVLAVEVPAAAAAAAVVYTT